MRPTGGARAGGDTGEWRWRWQWQWRRRRALAERLKDGVEELDLEVRMGHDVLVVELGQSRDGAGDRGSSSGRGTSAGNGGCSWEPPKLSSAPTSARGKTTGQLDAASRQSIVQHSPSAADASPPALDRRRRWMYP